MLLLTLDFPWKLMNDPINDIVLFVHSNAPAAAAGRILERFYTGLTFQNHGVDTHLFQGYNALCDPATFLCPLILRYPFTFITFGLLRLAEIQRIFNRLLYTTTYTRWGREVVMVMVAWIPSGGLAAFRCDLVEYSQLWR